MTELVDEGESALEVPCSMNTTSTRKYQSLSSCTLEDQSHHLSPRCCLDLECHRENRILLGDLPHCAGPRVDHSAWL
jgi:hypothetical protein